MSGHSQESGDKKKKKTEDGENAGIWGSEMWWCYRGTECKIREREVKCQGGRLLSDAFCMPYTFFPLCSVICPVYLFILLFLPFYFP